MATQIADYSSAIVNRKFSISWPGIFSGTFLFVAIEATFGVLGAAIFASGANASSQAASPNVGIGGGIWMVVLSIIALYFGGRLASAHSVTATRSTGVYAGLVTYGVCVFAALLASALASFASGAIGGHAELMGMNFLTPGGYWLFAAMVLGGIAAGFGGAHGAAIMSGQRTMERPNETKRVA